MTKRRHQCAQLCLLFGGIFFIILGVIIFFFLESVYKLLLNEALKFTPSSEAYKAWRTNDPPLDLDLYLFNWTNPEDVRRPHVKPRFEEVGPYRVKEIKEKTNLTWNDNSTISYRIRKTYFYEPKNSISDIDEDIVTTVNAIPLTVAFQTQHMNYFTRKFISLTMSSTSRLSVTATAKEILFEGYKDTFLDVLSKVPGLNAQDKFGIFYNRNDTIDNKSLLSMYIKNDESFGKQTSWNYKNHTDFYQGHCNAIKGSAGEFYPLHIKKSKLVFYSSELCKYAELEFVREEKVKGVLGYRFTADNIFDNGTTRPENKCFCTKECAPSGVLDVSSCRQNSPTFLSFPHFYAADAYYTDRIDGMEPEKNKHEFYIIIEPKTGIIMEIQATMQLNMLLQSYNGYSLYHDVPKIYVPMFYFSQLVGLSDELASNLRILQGLPEYLQYLSLIFVTLGTLLLVWGACALMKVCSPSAAIKHTLREEIPLNEKIGRT